jgi:hypothetical protein
MLILQTKEKHGFSLQKHGVVRSVQLETFAGKVNILGIMQAGDTNAARQRINREDYV